MVVASHGRPREGEDMAPHEEGHVHDESVPPTAPATSIGARLILTLVGAAAMIVGVFLDWLGGPAAGTQNGLDAPVEVFWSADVTGDVNFLTSAGFVVIVLGLLVILGAAMSTGWLSRLGAVLGIIAVVLFTITLYRVEGAELGVGDLGLGLWVILVGSILALVGGFAQQRPAVV
jgi:hypothetical protein